MKKHDITRGRAKAAKVMNALRITTTIRARSAGTLVAGAAAYPVVSSVPDLWAAAAISLAAAVAGWVAGGRLSANVGSVRDKSYAYLTVLDKVEAEARRAGCVEVLGKLRFAREGLHKVLAFEAVAIETEDALRKENPTAFQWRKDIGLSGTGTLGVTEFGAWGEKPYPSSWADAEARYRIAGQLHELGQEYDLIDDSLRAINANIVEAGHVLTEWKAATPAARLPEGPARALARARANLTELTTLDASATEMAQLRSELAHARLAAQAGDTLADTADNRGQSHWSGGPMGPMGAF